MKEAKESRETEGCTFKPEIISHDDFTSRTMISSKSLVNGTLNSFIGGHHRRKSPDKIDGTLN